MALFVGLVAYRDRRRGQGSCGARPRSGRGALRPTPGSVQHVQPADRSSSVLLGSRCGWAFLHPSPGSRRVRAQAPRRGLLGHPFAAQVGGMMGCAVVRTGRGQSEGATAPSQGAGVMTCTTRDRPSSQARSRCSRRRLRVVQRADFPVAQRVVHVGDLLAGRGYDTDVAAVAVLSDPVAVLADPGGLGHSLH